MFPGLVLVFNRSNECSNQGSEQRKQDDGPNGESELCEAGERIGAANLLTSHRIHAENKDHNDQWAEYRQT
jgi:hypothetical protein